MKIDTYMVETLDDGIRRNYFFNNGEEVTKFVNGLEAKDKFGCSVELKENENVWGITADVNVESLVRDCDLGKNSFDDR
jgi:hypothetical protein